MSHKDLTGIRRARAQRGAEAAKRSPKLKYPLRRVLSQRYDEEKDLYYDVLECGHEIKEARDLFSAVPRQKRRCRKCFEEQKETEE